MIIISKNLIEILRNDTRDTFLRGDPFIPIIFQSENQIPLSSLDFKLKRQKNGTKITTTQQLLLSMEFHNPTTGTDGAHPEAHPGFYTNQ